MGRRRHIRRIEKMAVQRARFRLGRNQRINLLGGQPANRHGAVELPVVAGDERVAERKDDLTDQWKLGPRDEEELARGFELVRTSAKAGTGVEDAFQRLGRAMLATREARS